MSAGSRAQTAVSSPAPGKSRPPLVARTGAGMVLAAWLLNASLPGMRTLILFFPLWLGVVLLLDGVVFARTGTSMMRRSMRRFLALFPMSFVVWSVFELLNLRTHNWEYLGDDVLDEPMFLLFSGLAFSTVMPAVLEAAELIRSFRCIDRIPRGPKLPPSQRAAIAFVSSGCAMLLLLLVLPNVFYAFMWISIYLIVEGVNLMRRNSSLLEHTASGDWRPLIALACGGLACGLLWEMWNYGSYPKWIYHTPGVEWLHLFEMPLLGYLGYIPFAWEVHALYCLLSSQAPVEW